jgi:nicotinate dehydrogenase subunit A
MELLINGVKRHCDFPANAHAVFALRNELDLKGVRMGCGEGHCGSCTVLVDGVPTTTCDLPFWALEGKHITTPEGVGTVAHPHPVQAAVLAEQPGQCGFCLSGILMSSVALVDSGKRVTEDDVRAALDKHLCRCGSQPRIIKAVMAALEQKAQTV